MQDQRPRAARRFAAALCLTATLLLLHACSSATEPPWLANAPNGMVAADHAEASQIGAEILNRGGNAFDAAVATSLALSVCRPESTGLGGGGFMLAYVAATQRFVVLDFRETAPAGATAERYARLASDRSAARAPGQPELWSPSILGGNAVATPGLLAGLAEINQRFGTRHLGELCHPAVELAERGFTIDSHYRSACKDVLADFEKWPALRQQCAALAAEILSNGVPPAEAARLPRPHLAAALRRIASDGPRAFSDGPVGEALVAAVAASGGCLTMDDLRGYRVKERSPIQFRFRDYQIVTVPPPSSGGVCLAQTLNTVEYEQGGCGLGVRYEDGALGSVSDVEHAHFLIESLKHAFANRARWLGDPDFAALRIESFLDKDYVRRIAERIVIGRSPNADPDAYGSTTWPPATPATQDSNRHATPSPPDDGGTSHFCIADRFGNIVSMTETINAEFGSYVVAEPFGIILNNEIDDLTTLPGQPNLFGLTQSDANLVAPGKRPLSSMTPTIILKTDARGESRPFLALGGSGGPRIISNVCQVALHVMNGRSLSDAIAEPRFHHQWQPDQFHLDRAPPDDRWRVLVSDLQRMGHKFSDQRRGASVQAIQFHSDGTLTGACDPKKGGRPAGVK